MRHLPVWFASFALLVGCGSSSTEEPASSLTSSTGGEAAGGSTALPPAGDLGAAIAGPQRSADNRARDLYRHPRETLEFFGIAPDMRVLEVRPGRGWYTEILAPYLRESGTLIAAIPSADGSRARYRQRFIDMQQERSQIFAAIELATFDPPSTLELGPDGSVDMVLTFRNTHNMINDDGAEAAYAAFFRVLRPGGVLGVVQHRGIEGADPQASAENGYVPEAHVIAIAEAAGFTLDDRSEVNANPNDTKDYEEGVWTLPPAFRLEDQDRDRYAAIGESDRMTLRFRKPE
ncbi:MAG: methyltransferase [Myxococcota bacterium]